jgi:hypothetical protein
MADDYDEKGGQESWVLYDPIVETVRTKLLARSQVGIRKYKTTLGREDLTVRQWLVHAQEEAMDLANYLEVLIQEYDKKSNLENS